MIRAGTFNNAPGTIITQSKDGTQKLSGFEVELFKIIANSLNLTVDFKIFPVSTGSFLPNKTATGLMRRAFEGEVDVIFALLSLQQFL